MRYDENYTSSDVEDRRAEGPVAGGGGGLPIGGLFWLLSRFGWHGLVLGLLIVGGVMIAQHVGGGGTRHSSVAVESGPEETKLVHFVEYVFDDVQKSWAKQIPNYRHAKLVLFRRSVRSACGVATAAVGPFYCPGDSKVYIDLAFYDELRRRFGAPGDFAQAYVIAHEVGHHVQNLLGLGHEGGSTVPIELQADCLAGAWGRDANARGLVEVGDLEEALNAASQIGDDTLQRKAGHEVQPDSFTHGSSAQRVANFRKGYDDGPHACGI
jgi:predicted metalloprotease